jgi:hypothetical protein
MDEMLSRFEPGHVIGLAAVVLGVACGIVGIVMGCWLEMRKVAATAALKQDMLNRGMSADEIRTVCDAGTPNSGKELRGRHSCRA